MPHFKIKAKTVKAANTNVAIPDHWAYLRKSAGVSIKVGYLACLLISMLPYPWNTYTFVT
jgi:hypothetical protein